MRKLSIVMLGLLLLPTAGLFAAAEGEMAADAPMPITWAGVGGAGVGENTVIEQLLEEKFNVEIDTIRYHQNDREKHNLLVASGEHPDAWYVWNFHDQKFMEGAYRTIPRSMIEEEMPFYVDAMNEIGTAGWAYFLAPGKTDEYWAIPRFQQQFGKEGNGAQHYLRYDWLERVGMTDFFDAVDQSPENKPDTFYWEPAVHDIDEFESVLAAFRDKLDFGDGQVRIPYGFTGDQTQAFMFRASLVLYAYGLNNKPSYDYDGDTVPPYGGELVMDGNCPCFRDATKRLQKWYSEGYIDPELPAVGFEQWKDRIASGVYGICTTCGVTGFGWEQQDGAGQGQGWTAVREDGAKWMAFTGLSHNGTYRTKYNNQALPFGSRVVAYTVNRNVSDEKLRRLLSIYDYVNFDPLGRIMAGSPGGLEGVHWEWVGEPDRSSDIALSNSPRKALEGWTFENVGGHYFTHQTFPARYAVARASNGHHQAWIDHYFTGPGQQFSLPPYKEDVFNQTDYTAIAGEVTAALWTIRDEFYFKAMTNADFDVDAEWDAHVEKYLNAGAQRLLDELGKLTFNVPDFKAGKISVEEALGQ